MHALTPGETRHFETIRRKEEDLRRLLVESSPPEPVDARKWLAHLTGIKSVLGNLSNDLGFVATLLIKQYLAERFGIEDFDAAGKPQGASGEDIVAHTADGRTIIGELKTTKPYQPGFGAAQRSAILKDLSRLAASNADHRFMFVTDAEAFSALCRPIFAQKSPGVEIVNLTSGEVFVCLAAKRASVGG